MLYTIYLVYIRIVYVIYGVYIYVIYGIYICSLYLLLYWNFRYIVGSNIYLDF